MTEANILQAKSLTRRYGQKNAINNIDLSISPGRVVGLCGPNGSGKSTLMQIAAGLVSPTGGEITICGLAVGKGTRALVSYMPDSPNIYGKMTVQDTLSFYEEFFLDFRRDKARSLITRFGLSMGTKTSNMSKGEVEKLQLALTLSRNAKLYLLDEPMSGIDKVARNEIIALIIDHCHDGASMLISTHIIGEMERVFEDVVFLNEGRVVLQGDCDGLRDQHGISIEKLYLEVYANGK